MATSSRLAHYKAGVEKELFPTSCIVHWFESRVEDGDLFILLAGSPGFYLLRMLFSHRHQLPLLEGKCPFL